MDSAKILENWNAAGRLAGAACGFELRKLALVKLAGPKIEMAKNILNEFKPFGQTAINAGIGATVGTIVGKSVGSHQHDEQSHTSMAPELFRAGFEAGVSEGLSRAAQHGIPKVEKI